MKAWRAEIAQLLIVIVCAISLMLMAFWASPSLHPYFFPFMTRFIDSGEHHRAACAGGNVLEDGVLLLPIEVIKRGDAVLAAAELLPHDANVGVLITDAEELALAGARAWARSRPPGVALNCDSIDDAGQLTVMYSGRRPDALVSRLVDAAKMQSEPVRVMRLIPGILTDSVALADAGWQTLTLSRGNLRTLQRIHTSRDTLDHLHGNGLEVAAQLLADTARTLS